ncbi:MAG: PAC2 family protein [Mycobacteriales bacterium]
MFHLVAEPAQLSEPVLIVALTGFVDAGSATRLVSDHLLETLNRSLVATFDVDLLLDYRSRRPLMQFVEDHWESYAEPRLDLYALTDIAGTGFLLLAGPEPDLHWERFTAALRGLISRFGVRLTVVLNAIPMTVPHTRPTGITAHATKPELIAGYEPWLQRILVPGSAAHLLEFRLGQEKRGAVGFAVHVPHYLTQVDYPAASEALLSAVSRVTGLQLRLTELHELAEQVRSRIDLETSQSPELASVVRSLEDNYDNQVSQPGGRLPTAEELGAEAERWLSEQGRREGPND